MADAGRGARRWGLQYVISGVLGMLDEVGLVLSICGQGRGVGRARQFGPGACGCECGGGPGGISQGAIERRGGRARPIGWR